MQSILQAIHGIPQELVKELKLEFPHFGEVGTAMTPRPPPVLQPGFAPGGPPELEAVRAEEARHVSAGSRHVNFETSTDRERSRSKAPVTSKSLYSEESITVVEDLVSPDPQPGDMKMNLRRHRAASFASRERSLSRASSPVTSPWSFSSKRSADNELVQQVKEIARQISVTDHFEVESPAAEPVPGQVPQAGGSDNAPSFRGLEVIVPGIEAKERNGPSPSKSSNRSIHSVKSKDEVFESSVGVVGHSLRVKQKFGTQFTSSEETHAHGTMKRIEMLVDSAFFDYLSGSLVILNAVFIGLQTDYQAANVTDVLPEGYNWANTVFCLLFTVELLIRILAYGRNFIAGSQWRWNVFDTILVSTQLADEILTHSAAMGATSMESGFNFSFLRILRILRLVRIIRIIRILRLIGELRAIVSSIAGSLKSLGWTVALLFLLVYVFGVYFTQMVLDHRVALQMDPAISRNEEDLQSLVRYYGSLGRSILSLYQAITGGVDWNELTVPIMNEIHVLVGGVIVLYIAFGVLALLNVVTGVFVESALKSAKEDRDDYMLHHVKALFQSADASKKGCLDWEDFKGIADNPQMLEFFRAIDVDPAQAQAVFQLLDADESGQIDLDEFLNGCLCLHGPAKAIDISTLRYELRIMAKRLDRCVGPVSRHAQRGLTEVTNVGEVERDASLQLSKELQVIHSEG